MDADKLRQLVEFQFSSRSVGSHWYLLAIAVLTAANAPELIPPVYILALLRSLPENKERDTDWLVGRVPWLLQNRGLLDTTFQNCGVDQRNIVDKINETILKSSAIVGIPRAINGLKYVKLYTPISLQSCAGGSTSSRTSRDEYYVARNHLKRGEWGTPNNLERGLKHWENTYGKVSSRIIQDLNDFYPDLWQFIVKNIYGDILSFHNIIDGPVTCLIVISSLIPMDVNPQLRGHLRSALNFGWDRDTINEVRLFAISISQWCGVRWKSEVTKL